MSEIKSKIMFLGKTGVGKSSLINYLLGENMAKVGNGRPETQKFNKYDLLANGINIEIFDSKGLEVNDYHNLSESIRKELKINFDNIMYDSFYSNKKNLNYNNFCSIFYCFSAKNRRIEEEEINFIKNLIKDLGKTINIVITNSDSLTPQISSEYKKMLKKIASDIKIFEINSITEEKRSGSVEQFGRENLINNMFEILRDDILEKFSYKVEKDIKDEIKDILGIIRVEIEQIIDRKLGFFGVFKIVQQSDELFDEITVEFESKLESMYEVVEKDINDKLSKSLKPVEDYFYRYKGIILNSFSHDRKAPIDNFDINLDFIDKDIEKWLDETKIGILIKKIDNDQANLGDFLIIGWKFITIGDTLKELCGVTIDRMMDEIDKQNFSVDIKKSLEEVF